MRAGLTVADVHAACGPYVAEQVAEFFAERGLVPVAFQDGHSTVLHAAPVGAALVTLCLKPEKRGRLLREAGGHELLLPQCRSCIRSYWWRRT